MSGNSFLPDTYNKLFPVQEGDFFEKVKENEELRGGVYGYAAQVTPQFNAEIYKKGRFWMETS